MRGRVFGMAAALWAGSVLWTTPQAAPASPPSRQEPSAVQSPAEYRALLDKYCVTCHNERTKTAGLLLDKTDISDVGSGADVWEKVVRKVRVGMVPPPGAP